MTDVLSPPGASEFQAPTPPAEPAPVSHEAPAATANPPKHVNESILAKLRHLLKDESHMTGPLAGEEKKAPEHMAVLSKEQEAAEKDMSPMDRIASRIAAKNGETTPAAAATVDMSRAGVRERQNEATKATAPILAVDRAVNLPDEVPFTEGKKLGKLGTKLRDMFHSRNARGAGLGLAGLGAFGVMTDVAHGAEMGIHAEAPIPLAGVDTSLVNAATGATIAESSDANLSGLGTTAEASGANLSHAKIVIVAPAGSEASNRAHVVRMVGIPAPGSSSVDLAGGGKLVVVGDQGLQSGSAEVSLGISGFEGSDSLSDEARTALAGAEGTSHVVMVSDGDQLPTVITGEEGQQAIIGAMAGDSVIFETSSVTDGTGPATEAAATTAASETVQPTGTSVSDAGGEGMSTDPQPNIVDTRIITNADGTRTIENNAGVGISETPASESRASVSAENEHSSEKVTAPEVKAPADITTTRETGEWKDGTSITTVTLADGTTLSYDGNTGSFTDAAGNPVSSPEAAGLVDSLKGYDEATKAKLTSGEAVVAVVDGVRMVVDASGNNVATGEAATQDPVAMAQLREKISGGGGTALSIEGTQTRDWKEVVRAGHEFEIGDLTGAQLTELFGGSTQEVANRLKPIKPKTNPDGSLVTGGIVAAHEWSTTEGENPVTVALINEAANSENGVDYAARMVLRVAGGANQDLDATLLTIDQGFVKTHADGSFAGGMDVMGNIDQTGVSGVGNPFFSDAQIVKDPASGDAYIVFGKAKGPCQGDVGGPGFTVGRNQRAESPAFDWSRAKGAGAGFCDTGLVTGTSGIESRPVHASAREVAVNTTPPAKHKQPDLPKTGATTDILLGAGGATVAAGVLEKTGEGILKRRKINRRASEVAGQFADTAENQGTEAADKAVDDTRRRINDLLSFKKTVDGEEVYKKGRERKADVQEAKALLKGISRYYDDAADSIGSDDENEIEDASLRKIRFPS